LFKKDRLVSVKYDAIFLKEVLDGITHQSNTLNKLLEFVK